MKRFVIMGVSGCGKSSIGAGFAATIGAHFIDGDDMHPQTNIAKMAAGTPLTDADRAPWLADVGKAFAHRDLPLVIGCSALKRAYRDIIREHAGGPVTFLYLQGSKALIAGRINAREGHFMPPALLESQFAALEVPDADERAIHVNIDQSQAAIVAELASHFQETAT